MQCGYEDHGQQCNRAPLCSNCGEALSASAKYCFYCKLEQATVHLQTREKISYSEAKRTATESFIKLTKTYTGVVKQSQPAAVKAMSKTVPLAGNSSKNPNLTTSTRPQTSSKATPLRQQTSSKATPLRQQTTKAEMTKNTNNITVISTRKIEERTKTSNNKRNCTAMEEAVTSDSATKRASFSHAASGISSETFPTPSPVIMTKPVFTGARRRGVNHKLRRQMKRKDICIQWITDVVFHIIQWNIQGYRAKFEELIEMKTENRAIICLQETMLGNNIPPDPKGYSYRVFSTSDVPVAGTEMLTAIRNDIPFYEIPVNTPLQAKAYRVRLNKEIIVCNLYIDQPINLTIANLQALFNQLPKQFAVFGDFNARSPLWGRIPLLMFEVVAPLWEILHCNIRLALLITDNERISIHKLLQNRLLICQ